MGLVNSDNFKIRIRPTLNYLLRSIEVNDYQGSSFSYSCLRRPWRPWHPSYPETTGYIINTLFNYQHFLDEESLSAYAVRCADWLCAIQQKNGAYCSLLAGGRNPSVFNTGMICLGLTQTCVEENDEVYLKAVRKAIGWLMDQLGDDPVWQRYGYVEGFSPTYYSELIWSVLFSNQLIKDPSIDERMRSVILYLMSRYKEQDREFSGWGFKPGKPAYTHTIAYTLHGFLESARILGMPDIVHKVDEVLDKIIEIYSQAGLLAGAFGMGWIPQKSFTCPTGNAQLSILYSTRYVDNSRKEYQHMARALLIDIRPHIRTGRFCSGMRGALPGSVPFYGPYLRFHHPNWAAKFYLDAELALEKSQEL